MRNYTPTDQNQNAPTIIECLSNAGVEHLMCQAIEPNHSAGGRGCRSSASWPVVVTVGLLVGSLLGTL
jgi:hypothetical protein